jgi:ribosomal protein L6P/L9E
MLQKILYNQKFQNSFLNPLKILYTKNQKFLIFQNKNKFFKLISVPNAIIVKKKNQNLIFELISLDKILYYSFLNFQKLISYTLKQFNKRLKKSILLKGLGLRINYLAKTKVLVLKLGFSNLISISIPTTLIIYKKKNLLTIEGYDHALVGNFAYLIRSLRYPDSYKGKGLWYKNENFKLKSIKKT